MPKVSIVVPVYNMQKYLAACIKSLKAQTLSDIEIILVDDGSSDNSPALCDAYAQENPMIRVVHKPNGGLTSAWKRGSEEATGDYIGYVDADDYILPDMYERMYTRACETGADIVCCGLTHLYEDDPSRKWTEQMEFRTDSLERETLANEIYPTLINDGSFMGRHLQPNRVTKLVRTELVKKNLQLCSDAVSIGEDFQFSLCMFLDARHIEIIRDYFPYQYYMNGASMTMKHDRSYPEKIHIMRENLCRISDVKGMYDFKQQIWNDYLCLLILYTKGIVYKQKELPYSCLRTELRQLLTTPEVRKAICIHTMDKLTIAEKLFLSFMKHRLYYAIYAVVKLYFRN